MPPDERQVADYVRIDLAALRRGVVARLTDNPYGFRYEEGWNDALYTMLDILDGNEPYEPRAALTDGDDRG